MAIFDGFGSLGVSEVSGFAAERQIFGTFFLAYFRMRRIRENPETLVFQRSGVFYSRASGGVELYGHRIVGSCETDKALFCLGSWQVQSRSLEGDFRMIVTVLSPRISGWMSV